VGGGWAQGKQEQECIWWIYFVSIYENSRMNPVEIVLKREKWRKRENDGGINLTNIYYKHICKYHTVSPCTTIMY
jgi:hypothetical protein